MRAWHGTLERFDDFQKKPSFTSFALEPDGARIYAIRDGCDWEEGARLFQVELSVTRILDYRDPDHAKLALEYLREIGFSHFHEPTLPFWISRGAYQTLEHLELLRRHDFQAVYTNEWGWNNIHLLEARLVSVVRVFDHDPGDFGELGEGRCKAGWCPPSPSSAA